MELTEHVHTPAGVPKPYKIGYQMLSDCECECGTTGVAWCWPLDKDDDGWRFKWS